MSQKVLVVEDDINIAELLRLYLQKDGFEVSHAADGGKAVEMAKEIQPDLVLLDIMLPVMDGWNVLRTIRQDYGSAESYLEAEYGLTPVRLMRLRRMYLE